MKQNKISIKWKLFGCFALFTAIVLSLLWLFQIIFLNDFYKIIKIQEIKLCAKNLAEELRYDIKYSENNELLNTAKKISEKNEVCILILDIYGNQKLSTNYYKYDCVIHNISSASKYKLYLDAKNRGGESLDRFKKDAFKNLYYSIGMDKSSENQPHSNNLDSIIYTKIIQMEDGSEIVIMLNSIISPVDATVKTLFIQIVIISILLSILCAILAFIISKRISRPIININESAKVLATGNYDVKFNNSGYKEIAELGNTLNYAAVELSKVDGLRKELIANISHDLRTPLTMIAGYSEVMRDIPGENTPENIQIIIEEAKRLTSLVNDVLDISKLQSGTQELNLTQFNLTDIIKKSLLRYTKLVEQDGYIINFVCDANQEVEVNADETKVLQVIYNLVNNAINYTGDDKTITVKQSTNGNYVKIEIIDTGNGIAEEQLPLIWDRYYKVDKIHKRSTVGTGLGLSIVKTIIDMHNGKYGVDSTIGVGTSFWVEFIRITDEQI